MLCASSASTSLRCLFNILILLASNKSSVLAMSLWGEAVLKESLINAPRLRTLNDDQKSEVIRQQQSQNDPRKKSSPKKRSRSPKKKSGAKAAKKSGAKAASTSTPLPEKRRGNNKKRFPRRWGAPPEGSMPDEDEWDDIDTIAWQELPAGYGTGSQALAKWVQSKLDKEASGAGGRASGTNKAFPRRWGAPPSGSMPDEDEFGGYDMNDWYELPGGYGKGSSKLGKWVQSKLDKDKSKGRATGAGRTRTTTKPFPRRWGGPPVGTMPDDDDRHDSSDWVDLPEGYGRGSPTLAKWIKRKLRKDRSKGRASHSTSVLTKPFPQKWGVAPDEDEYGGYDMNDWIDLPEGYGRGPPPLAKWVQSKLQGDNPPAKKASSKKTMAWTKVKEYEDSASHSEEEQLSSTDFGVVNVNGRMQLVGVELFEFYDDPAIQAALEATLLVAADPPAHLAQAIAAHIIGLSSAPDGSAKVNFQVINQTMLQLL